MKNDCEKWKDQLLDVALSATASADFEKHLRGCAICSSELDGARARKARLDGLLPLVARGAEPPADFRTRVLAAAEATNEGKRAHRWRLWTMAGAASAIVVLLIGVKIYRRTAQTIPPEDVAAVQKLAEWRAPSDSLLVTPGQEILKTMPRFGQSYLNVPAKRNEEE
jgi:anti-sigma factor RsiW